MAPKKSTKGKDVEAEPTCDEGWTPSKCSDSDLESLVSAGLLPVKSVIQWRSALGQDRPYENMGEIVAFALYFNRDWGSLVRICSLGSCITIGSNFTT